MTTFFRRIRGGGAKPAAAAMFSRTQHNMPQQTSYESKPVALPDDFLVADPPDFRGPPTCVRIDWAATPLPANAGHYAVVLDNVLSPSECAEMLRLAEESAPESGRRRRAATERPASPSSPSSSAAPGVGLDGGGGNDDEGGASSSRLEPKPEPADPWHPALVNVGPGFEVLTPNYRNGDRIVWDSQELVDRLWARCLARAPELAGQVGAGAVQNSEAVLGMNRWAGEEQWEFRRLNERMRFLRYRKGQFSRPHCDGSYRVPGDKVVRTLYTLHLYLNDCNAEAPDGGEGGEAAAGLVGGATTFLSADGDRRVDVNCRAGRVLIFQHRGLLHAGDDVVVGTKYTMRTDIMYEMVKSGKEEEEGKGAVA